MGQADQLPVSGSDCNHSNRSQLSNGGCLVLTALAENSRKYPQHSAGLIMAAGEAENCSILSRTSQPVYVDDAG